MPKAGSTSSRDVTRNLLETCRSNQRMPIMALKRLFCTTAWVVDEQQEGISLVCAGSFDSLVVRHRGMEVSPMLSRFKGRCVKSAPLLPLPTTTASACKANIANCDGGLSEVRGSEVGGEKMTLLIFVGVTFSDCAIVT